ncbi:hypothetical protein EYF80_049132 [Liparis tanakae]|uniref:Uncharacterized protein n=1 Tax=Liparis tanakae TaxID=230148 RepID=A0A4Z2FIC4_9TELE|nr:hypothetical protein EYF80_049132 [Liparis tanakae]
MVPLLSILSRSPKGESSGLSNASSASVLSISVEVEVPVGIQQLWVQAVDQRDAILDLSLQDHLSDLNPLV